MVVRLATGFLLLDVLADSCRTDVARSGDEIGTGPGAGHPLQGLKFLPQEARAVSFYSTDQDRRRYVRRRVNEQMHMIGHCFQSDNLAI